MGGIGNLNYGYAAGGFPGPSYSTVDRIDYSNDTATASVRGPLSGPRMLGDSASNMNYGYIIGGRTQGSPSQSTIDRIDFSNDTATASPKGPLSSSTVTDEYLSATGNANFAYVSHFSPSTGGGKLYKIDYSNDTVTPPTISSSFDPIRISLSNSTTKIKATGNDSFGYFAGGGIPAPISYVSRLDYSNDTAAAIVRGPLTRAVYNGAMTSVEEHGLPQ